MSIREWLESMTLAEDLMAVQAARVRAGGDDAAGALRGLRATGLRWDALVAMPLGDLWDVAAHIEGGRWVEASEMLKDLIPTDPGRFRVTIQPEDPS